VVNSIRRGSRPRSNGLDFVRATAIVWVMIYHAMIFDLVPDPDHWFVAFGWMGVDLFFVLSGFLIAGQLIAPFADGSTPDYRKFFARRLLRTLPAYFAVVGIYAFIPAAWERQAMQPLWQFLTFTENLLYVADAPKAFSHVWSLCVEEQFYLLLPAVAALVALRPSAGKARALLFFFLVAGMVVRARLWLDQVALPHFDSGGAPQGARYMELIYYPTWSRLDGLLAGVALAVLQTFRPKRWTFPPPDRGFMTNHGRSGGTASTVAIVQGNVPRLGLEFNAQRRAVLDNHVAQTRRLADDVRAGRTPRPDLVIWPENASDIDPIRNADAAREIRAVTDEIGVPVPEIQVHELTGEVQVAVAGVVPERRSGAAGHRQRVDERLGAPRVEHVPAIVRAHGGVGGEVHGGGGEDVGHLHLIRSAGSLVGQIDRPRPVRWFPVSQGHRG